MSDDAININLRAKKLQDEVWKNTSLWKKNFLKAIEILEQALKTYPDDIITLTNHGAALCDSGHHEEAKTSLARAIENGSTDRNTYFNMAVSIINTTRIGHMDYFEKASKLESSEYTWQAYFDPYGY